MFHQTSRSISPSDGIILIETNLHILSESQSLIVNNCFMKMR